MYLTKDRNVKVGQKKVLDFSFKAATPEEIKKAIGDNVPDGYVAGWASTPDIDSYNHKVVPGAFLDAIQTRGLKGPKGIKLLIGHNWNQIGGEIKVLEYRGSRLWIEAQMALQIGYVRDAYEAAKMLGGLNFSVGFMLQDYEFRENTDGTEYLQINRGDLFEVSIVPFPGNEEATMTFIKDGTGDENGVPNDDPPNTLAEFEKSLVASGLVKNRNDAQAVTLAVKKCVGLFKGKEEPVSTAPTQKGPMLDLNKITELGALVAKMKQVISAPAAE